jgi:hypothetical protein
MISNHERQILRQAINRAHIEVRKAGTEHIDQALDLLDNGTLNQESLEQVRDHLIRAIEHSRLSQPLSLARAIALTIAASLGLRAKGE